MKRPLIIAILALSALALAACAPLGGAVSAQQNTINVSGTGTAYGAPDKATVDLGVTIRGQNLGQVIEDANRTMTALTDAVKELGVAEEDVQTTNFYVYTEEIYSDGAPTGQQFYSVENLVQITVRDTSKLSDIIGAALDAGANRVNGVTFGISDSAALEAEARAAAVASAKQHAQELADALGVQVGKPISISEMGISMPVVAGRGGVSLDAASAAPPVSPGQLSVNSSVYVVFELLP